MSEFETTASVPGAARAPATRSVLSWPIKSAFRRYVESLPDGAVEADAGAVIRSDTFDFPLVRPLDGHRPLPASLAAGGEIAFTGHGGYLMMPFRDPALRQTHGGHLLSIANPSALDDSLPRLEIAHVSWCPWEAIDATRSRIVAASVTLTSDGSDFFNRAYPPGALFDPLILITADPAP